MLDHISPLVNWSNGIVMIAIFAAVCVILVATVLILMNSGRKKE
jgi:hypothetical protein